MKAFRKNNMPFPPSLKHKSTLFITALLLLFAFSISNIYAQSASITFNDLANPDRALDGQYPTGVADWGVNKWRLIPPIVNSPTNTIVFANEGIVSATFDFVAPMILTSVKVSNEGIDPSTAFLT